MKPLTFHTPLLVSLLLVSLSGPGRAWADLATWQAYIDEASAVEQQQDYAYAETLYRKAQQEAVDFSPNSPKYLGALMRLNNLYLEQHQYAKADALLVEMLELDKTIQEHSPVRLLRILMDLAQVNLMLKQPDKAKAYALQALEADKKYLFGESAAAQIVLQDILTKAEQLKKDAE